MNKETATVAPPMSFKPTGTNTQDKKQQYIEHIEKLKAILRDPTLPGAQRSFVRSQLTRLAKKTAAYQMRDKHLTKVVDTPRSTILW